MTTPTIDKLIHAVNVLESQGMTRPITVRLSEETFKKVRKELETLDLARNSEDIEKRNAVQRLYFETYPPAELLTDDYRPTKVVL